MNVNRRYVFPPIVNLILYDSLLVATPFLMLQNYLQQTIREISGLTINIFIWETPIVFLVFIIACLSLLVFLRKQVTFFRLSTLLIIVLMMLIGQETADYYLNYKFYDLQNNWHYFAYGLFVFVFYRFLISKNCSDSKIILLTLFKAFLISSFDEGIQV